MADTQPANGEPRHRFTETLPRLHGDSGECLECERNYEAHVQWFELAARNGALPKLDRWLDRNALLMLWQLTRRWRPRRRSSTPAGSSRRCATSRRPTSTGPG